MSVRMTGLALTASLGFLVAPASASDDVCVYKTQDWSLMREFLVQFSKQDKNMEVAEVAAQALRGAKTHSIGTFEIVYGSGKTGQPPPNDQMCYPKAVNFTYTVNTPEDESTTRCTSAWREDETLSALECELIAG